MESAGFWNARSVRRVGRGVRVAVLGNPHRFVKQMMVKGPDARTPHENHNQEEEDQEGQFQGLAHGEKALLDVNEKHRSDQDRDLEERG